MPKPKLLLVMGRTPQELSAAAQTLALGSVALSGATQVVGAPDIPERQAYDAPRWIPMNRPVRFGELVQPTDLQGNGLVPGLLTVNFRTAPDIFVWGNSGIPLDVRYRYPAGTWLNFADSRLDVSINNSYLRSLPLTQEGVVQQVKDIISPDFVLNEQTVRMPPYYIFGQNQLQFYYDLRPMKRGECQDVLPNNVQESIDPDSTIDLSGTERFTTLPNLAFFVNSGYPFTKFADLSQTAVVIPDQLTPADVQTYLTLMGMMGDSTGFPVARVSVVDAAGVDQVANKDLIVLGAVSRQPLIAKWSENARLRIEDGRLRVAMTSSLDRVYTTLDPERQAGARAGRPAAGAAGRQPVDDDRDGVAAEFGSHCRHDHRVDPGKADDGARRLPQPRSQSADPGRSDGGDPGQGDELPGRRRVHGRTAADDHQDPLVVRQLAAAADPVHAGRGADHRVGGVLDPEPDRGDGGWPDGRCRRARGGAAWVGAASARSRPAGEPGGAIGARATRTISGAVFPGGGVMKSWAREFALGLLLATAIPSARVLAAQSAEQILLDKANYWRLKDRPDLATEALQQLLSINPNQPDALYQFGIIKVQQGKIDEARTYLGAAAEGRPVEPAHRRSGECDSRRPGLAERAVRGAAAGAKRPVLAGRREIPADLQGAAAADLRRRILHDAGRHAAGLGRGAGRPRTAGAELAERQQGQAGAGRGLTYHADTRARGIRSLAQLSDDSVVGPRRSQSWKQAMMWLGAGPEDRPLYNQYLRKFPNDAEVRQHMAEVGKPGAPGPASAGAAGYGDLNRGNLAQPNAPSKDSCGATRTTRTRLPAWA